jgi:glutaminyl-peptide cyclotransferase
MSKYQLPSHARSTSFMPVARACAVFVGLFCSFERAYAQSTEKFLRYEIVATHPHDSDAFTQGLAWHQGRLLESAGGNGRSTLVLREVASSHALKRHKLADAHFAEGVAGDGRRLVQLTWQSGVALVYDLALRPIGRFSYTGEGWGLTFDGERWLMSDGSSRITTRDRDRFTPTGGFEVRARGKPLSRLNELEYAHGRLYANLWHSDRVAVIDVRNGEVTAWLDLGPLRRGFVKPAGWNEREHVLNGIAHDPATGHLFVTGKCWPVLYELRLADAP